MSKKVPFKVRVTINLAKINIIKGSFLAIAGYILSPLSWWNDVLVNIPIAMFLTKVTRYIIQVDYYILFTIYYWTTNIAGLIMMYLGGNIALNSKGRIKGKELISSLLFSTFYTLIMVVLLKLLNG